MGPFSAGAGESLSGAGAGGGAQPGSQGIFMPACLSGYRQGWETRACTALGRPCWEPWEPEGLAWKLQEVF